MSSFLKEFEEYMNTGNPVIREWFLVNTNFWPVFLCIMYFLIVKVIGPSYMKNREPFELRFIMLFYNMFLVATYTISIIATLDCVRQGGFRLWCDPLDFSSLSCVYRMATTGWVIYLLKYVEFLDTIFFILRKKNKLITNLHVIHHTALPLIGWVLLRTEESGFQALPVMINSLIHVVMYSYYGLAALGPGMQKYLWWKRYLTIAQMIQFVLIAFIEMVFKPISGCSSAKSSQYANLIFSTLFFILFYNFYRKTFEQKDNRKIKSATADIPNDTAKETVIVHENGRKKGN